LDVGDAGDFDRILKAQKQPRRRALMRVEIEQIRALERHRSAGHFVARLPAQNMGERRFARAIGAHDRMDFACGDL